jgi:hypothetical protein
MFWLVFNSQIADAILASLKKFGDDKYDRIRAVRHSPGERAQFLKRHVAVGVEELVSRGLIIRPLHHEGGGFVGLDEDAITLSESDLPHKLADAIAEAFNRAT